MINNNNNNKNDSNNEILFWKVFKNKVLINNIINQIEELNNGRGSNIKRMKFKDIKSLEWLIKNKQYSLLKCKLEANEDIEIEKSALLNSFKIIGLGLFKFSYYEEIKSSEYDLNQYQIYNKFEKFNKFDGYFLNNGEYIKGEEFIEINNENLKYYKERDEKIIEIENIMTIIQLLLKFKIKELINLRIVDIILKNVSFYYSRDNESIVSIENQDIINNQLLLLSNDQYYNSIIIDEETIELAIKKSTPSLLNNLLLNLKNRNLYNQVINDKVKNNSISWISSNRNCKDKMYEFILNDKSLYNIPPLPSTTSSTCNFISNKRLKSSLTSYLSKEEEEEKVLQQQNEVIKINIDTLFKINSQIIQMKLLNLNYIMMDYDDEEDYQEGDEELKKQLLILLDNSNNQIIIIKELFKLYLRITRCSGFYKDYLHKYDEVIDEFKENNMVLKYTLYSKSLNGLKYLISKYNELGHVEFINSFEKKYVNYEKSKEKKKFELLLSNEIIEFIRLYLTIYHNLPNCFGFEKILIEFIFSIKSKQEYDKLALVPTVIKITGRLEHLLPENWFGEFTIKIKEKLCNSKNGYLIQDSNEIDYIYNNIKSVQLFYTYFLIDYTYSGSPLFFKFQTIQLLDYAKLKYGSNSIFFENYPSKGDVTTITSTIIDGINSSYYIYPYTTAINNCDIESLKLIEQLLLGGGYGSGEIKFTEFEYYNPISNKKYTKFVCSKIKEVEEIKKSLDQDEIKINFNDQATTTSNSIIAVIDYFNSSGYKLFSNKLFIKFIKDLSKLDSNIIKVSDLKIENQSFQNESFQLLLNSITNDISSNLIQILLNNFNPFTEIEMLPLIKSQIDKWKEIDIPNLRETSYYYYNKHLMKFNNFTIWSLYFTSFDGKEGPFCSYSYESPLEIIESIKLILNHMMIHNKLPKGVYDIIQEIINHLFKRLIKINQVSIDQVCGIYQYIKSTWLSITGAGGGSSTEFIFEHSQYHVFFYLGIRSIKFMKDFLMKLQYIVELPGEKDLEGDYYCEEEEDMNSREYLSMYNFRKLFNNLLSPTLFTYDFIFKSRYIHIYNLLLSNATFAEYTYSSDDESLIFG